MERIILRVDIIGYTQLVINELNEKDKCEPTIQR